MKTLIIFLAFIVMAYKLFSQKIETLQLPLIEKKALLSKSRLQKGIGWTILATGIPIAVTTGYLLTTLNKDVWDETAGVMVFAGSIAYTLVSIPLLKAGRRNKKRALSITLISDKLTLRSLTPATCKNRFGFSLGIPFN